MVPQRKNRDAKKMLNRFLAAFSRANAHYPAVDRSQAIIEFRPDGVIKYANKNFLDAMGYNMREIKGKHHSIFVDPSERSSQAYQTFWAELRSGKFQMAEFKRISKSGDEVWIQASYNPIFNVLGQVTRVVKFATVITAEKIKSLKDAGKIDAINTSQAVIEFDMDGTIVTANQNFLDTLGYRLAEVVGKHHSLFVDPDYAKGEPYRKFWDELRDGKFQSAEFKRIGKGGKEIWIQAIYNPIFDPSGKPLGVVKFAIDVTQQVKARQQAEFLSVVTNETDNSVVITDADGRIEFVNAGFERMTGYRSSEAIGQKPGDLLQGGNTDPEAIQRIRNSLAEKRPLNEDILNYTKSGDPYWISLAVNPILGKDGNVERFVSIQVNITDAKMSALAFDARLQAIGSGNAIAEWDVSGSLTMQNDLLSDRAGYARRAGAGIETLLDPASISAIRDGSVVRREINWPSNREQPLWFDAVFATTKNIDGDVDKFVMFGADVSDRCSIVGEAMEALDAVVTSSLEISKIVKSLDQIAGQTNMLSLNAAVEAAHAGEAGAGFGVVSREIGALAARSTKESKHIADLAQQSQKQVQELSSSLHQLGNEESVEIKANVGGAAALNRAA